MGFQHQHQLNNGLGRRTINGCSAAYIDKTFNRPNPKTFEGVENGKWWVTRIEASRDGCHAPTVAGISGNEKEGCWSIALSVGYEDDVDEGYSFTYTGSGGRDLKGTKAKPKESSHCTTIFRPNSYRIEIGLESIVRYSQSNQSHSGLQGHSKWAPSEGYRYTTLHQNLHA
jgi:E3 ubiquitin-protein ligase UHRF1